jgi:hypothetical protein
MRKSTKRNLSVAAITVVLLGGAGAAFAYWTAGGSGTGTAATGDNVDLVAVQTSTVTGMGPGIAAQDLEGNFNNDNDGPTYVATVTASIASVTPLNGQTCDDSNYTINNPVAPVGAEVPVGTGVGSWSGPSIEFVNSATVNQDGCKGATVNIAYAIG